MSHQVRCSAPAFSEVADVMRVAPLSEVGKALNLASSESNGAGSSETNTIINLCFNQIHITYIFIKKSIIAR